MSTERIDHVAEARRLIDAVKEAAESIEGEFYAPEQLGVINAALDRNVAVAAVEAQLALVEQQRIANLIAVMANALVGVGAGEHSAAEYARLHQRINPQILAALGLNEGEKG